MHRRILFVSLALLAAAASSAQGQQQPRQYLSVNPIALMFEVVSADFERAVSPRLTAGVSATHFGLAEEDFGWSSVDAKLRYYPNERAPHGFSLGALLGYARASETSFVDMQESRDGRNALAAGVSLDYNWLLGPGGRVVAGTGVGAKRLWVLNKDHRSDTPFAYPTVRVTIGVAF